MALIVEDGTGLPNAESYSSVAEADTYHADRANTAWAALATAAKEASLRKATEYIDAYYTFTGYRKTITQALDWPRYEVPRKDVGDVYGLAYWPDDEVNYLVKRACNELALKASTEELTPDVDTQVIREKVGPLEVEYGANARQYKQFRQIDLILTGLIAATAGSMQAKLLRV